jgi:hypothetical protein
MTFLGIIVSLLTILGPSNDKRFQRQVNVNVTPLINAHRHVTVTVSPIIHVNVSLALGSGANARIRPETKKQSKQRKKAVHHDRLPNTAGDAPNHRRRD